MARKIVGRLSLTGTLRALTPLHVGGHGDDVDTDLPLARNGAGRWYIPGTSFAGALRDWCVRAFTESATNVIWGFQDPNNEDKGEASHVFVADAMIPEKVVVEVRDGVGIDRAKGCAASQVKYDRAVLPRGTEFPFRLSVEVPDSQAKTIDMFAKLKKALEQGAIRLGAAKTRGLGRVQLIGANLTQHDFKTKAGILAFLGRRKEHENGEAVAEAADVPATGARVIVTIDWEPIGPLMVKAGVNGIGVDMLPLMSQREGGLSLVIPGSSIKGVFRTQAERIVRTVTGINLPNDPKDFGKPVEGRDSHPSLIEMLFGSPGRDDEPVKSGNKKRLGLSALAADDCSGTQTITNAQWQRIAEAAAEPLPGESQSPLRKALHDAELDEWTAAYHVAIDRWTGGAAESFLYTVMEPLGTLWEPVRLELELSRLQDDERMPAMALLLFVLRDFARSRLPLGFATHRGMGAVRVNSIAFQVQGAAGRIGDLHEKQLPGGDLSALPPEIKKDVQDGWQTWLTKAKVNA